VTTLLGICGSLRRASLNRSLLDAIAKELPAGSAMTVYPTIELPIFNTDVEDPAVVTELKSAIAAADGVVFAVPEYNYSIPGGLKNALDWVSRPPRSSPLRRKPIAIVGATSGMSGTIRAQLHLRQILLYSDARVMSQPEILIPRAHERFTDGALTDDSTRQLLVMFGAAFVEMIEGQAS
jgi:chromate reductase